MPRTIDDGDATGRYQDEDEWSLASFDVRSCVSESMSFDVRSMASEDDEVISQASSSRSGISATETFGDHLFESDTAYTAGLVPLAALPPGVLLPRHTTIADDQSSEAGSLRSVNTRRGWPRVQPGQRIPGSQQQLAMPPRGSYLDALLRDPSDPPAPSHEMQQQALQQQRHGGGSARAASTSGWVTLPRRARGARLRARLRGPEIPLCPLEEEANEEQELMDWPPDSTSSQRPSGAEDDEFELVAVP